MRDGGNMVYTSSKRPPLTKPSWGMLGYTLRHPIMGLMGSEGNNAFPKEDMTFSSFVSRASDTNIPALRVYSFYSWKKTFLRMVLLCGSNAFKGLIVSCTFWHGVIGWHIRCRWPHVTTFSGGTGSATSNHLPYVPEWILANKNWPTATDGCW
jgi:hypothetical protein